MPDPKVPAVTEADAKVFIARYGLKSLGDGDVAAMRAAIEKALAAGLSVPRAASRFDAPAPAFRVSGIR